MDNILVAAGEYTKLVLTLDQLGMKKTDLKITLQQDSQLDLKLTGEGEFSGELNLQIDLVGAGANAKVDGAFYLQGKSSFKVNSIQNHLINDAQSDLNIRTVLADQTVFDYSGMIFIAENGSGTDANQQNKNIVLSDEVKVSSMPNIEVLNEDVQCGHGSAIGDLDAEQVFYLVSRGISNQDAEKILINSFLNMD